MAKYLLHVIGVQDPETPDGTRAVHIAFGHRNTELIGLFLSLKDGDEMKERAKNMAIDVLRDDEATADRDPLTMNLMRFLNQDWDSSQSYIIHF